MSFSTMEGFIDPMEESFHEEVICDTADCDTVPLPEPCKGVDDSSGHMLSCTDCPFTSKCQSNLNSPAA